MFASASPFMSPRVTPPRRASVHVWLLRPAVFLLVPCMLLAFVPFLVFMWVFGLKQMRRHAEKSVFKNGNQTATLLNDENENLN